MSPFVGPAGEMGDVYVRDIKNQAVKIKDNVPKGPAPKAKKKSRRKTGMSAAYRNKLIRGTR